MASTFMESSSGSFRKSDTMSFSSKRTDKRASETHQRPSLEASDTRRLQESVQQLTINNFNDGAVKFKGGFAMEGKEIKGMGDKENKASFEFYYEGEKRVSATSSNFSISSTDSEKIQYSRICCCCGFFSKRWKWMGRRTRTQTH